MILSPWHDVAAASWGAGQIDVVLTTDDRSPALTLGMHLSYDDSGPVKTGWAQSQQISVERLLDQVEGAMADRIKAALGSLTFLVLAPGVVAGLIPWLMTDWRPLPPSDGPGALRWTGVILIAPGLAVVLESFARFAWEGLGTPAPVAPTRTLVVTGFYRFVRNPMYVAVTALIFGQAVLFASWGVALYGVVIAAAFVTFVRFYEEPTLREVYGEEYLAYCAATPRWIPRFRRWRPAG